MTSRRTGWDHLALAASLLSTATGIGYLRLIGGEDDQPVLWFLTPLVLGVLLAIHGAAPGAPARTAALAVSGSILVGLGLVGIFSVGLPLLVAGALVWTAVVRSTRPRDRSPVPR